MAEVYSCRTASRRGFAAVMAVMAAFAGITLFADMRVWNGGGDGHSWGDPANWGGVAPGEGDTAVISNVSTTISFPSDVDQTKFTGTIHVVGPVPTSSATNEVVFDATGTTFYYTNNVEDLHPFIRGWNYASSKWQATANRIYFDRRYASSQSPYSTEGTFTLKEGKIRARMSSKETRLVQESGKFDWSTSAKRRLMLLGGVANNITNTAVFELKGGVLSTDLLNLRPYSRFVMTDGELLCTTIALLPNNRNGGNNYGAGPTEFAMYGGISTNFGGGLYIGQYGGASARSIFRMGGTAMISRNANTTQYSDRLCDIIIAGRTAGNSGIGLGGYGELSMEDSSSITIRGKSNESGHYGDLLMAISTNCTARLSMSGTSSITLTYGDVYVATAYNGSGVISLSGDARFTHGGYVSQCTCLGGAESAEAALEIADNAIYTTPKLVAHANSSALFERAELVLSGGALVAGAVEGSNTLMVVAAGGVLRAKAASTAAAPFLSGIKSFSGAGGAAATVIIDTQSYVTYVDQDFGVGATVVKRGTGTLYVKNSNHAKTVIEAGTVVLLDESKHFGDEWEVTGSGVAPWPEAGPAAEGDTLILSFSSKAAAEAFAEYYQSVFSPTDGYGYTFAETENGDGTWRVTMTTATASGSSLVWSGATGGAWDAAANWTPAQVPTHNDDVLIGASALIAMPSLARAHDLVFADSGAATLSGTGELKLNALLSVSNTVDAVTALSVAEGGAMSISVATQEVVHAAVAKEGAGALTMDFTAKGRSFPFGSGSLADKAALSIREGSMEVRGIGAAIINQNFRAEYTTLIPGPFAVGTTSRAEAPALAELVFDNCGASGVFTVGGGNAAVARLVVTNKTIAGGGNITVSAAAGKTAELSIVDSSVGAMPGCTITLGAAAANCGTTRVEVGEGGRMYNTLGGYQSGAIMFGGGLVMRIVGGIVEGVIIPTTNTRLVSWIRGNAYAHGTVTVETGGKLRFGGGFAVNNYNIAASAEKKFTMVFDGGAFVPMVPTYGPESQFAAYETTLQKCTYCLMAAPEHQGFNALSGGMIVDMASCPRYTIACPVRGEGAVVKRGAGTLVMGTGRKFASGCKDTWCYDSQVTNDATKVVTSGVVTVQCAGGVSVEDGAVELEAGATDAGSVFAVASGAALDLGGNAVSVGALSGAGAVTNGTLSEVTLKAAEDGGDAPTFKNVVFAGPVKVDFGRDESDPASKTVLRKVAILGENVTGLLTPGAKIDCAAVNTGSDVLTRAKITVDGEGVAWAVPCVKTGFLIYVK